MLKINSRYEIRHLNSFFQEIIVVILFFSLSCAIIVQVFVNAYLINLETEERNSAVMTATSFCEVYSVNGSLSQTVALIFGEDAVKYIHEQNATLPLDDNFSPTENEKVFIFHISTRTTFRDSGNVHYADISVYKNGESIFSVTSSAYLPKGVALID